MLAAELFAEYGYAGTTIDAVATAAGGESEDGLRLRWRQGSADEVGV